MARTQAENYPEIRREILRRSAALFARHGYANASIADLAEANKVSRGLLYHYFDSKEKILAEMLHEHLDMLLAAVKRAAASTGNGRGDAESRFRETVRTMVSINAESQDLQVVLLHDLQNLKPTERAAIVGKQREIIRIVGEIVSACDTRGKITRRTQMAETMMLIGMINYTYLWYDPAGPVKPAEYAAMVADNFLGGLRA
jgi:AcrR family transcriptional regulator